jgi:hypothetical protein
MLQRSPRRNLHAGALQQPHYDFLLPRGGAPAGEPGTAHQIAGAIAGYQKAIAETDKRLDGIEQRGGSIARCNVFTRDTPEKRDDRAWFERNPQRAHRVRMPFPGEAGDAAEKTPAGHAMIILVRQIEPGSRLRHSFYLNADLLPVPDDEAVAHALFEVAVGNEPVPPDGRVSRPDPEIRGRESVIMTTFMAFLCMFAMSADDPADRQLMDLH